MKKIFLVLFTILVMVGLSGCNEPELKEIEPSQTAFLLPMSGDTTKQAQLSSESFLKKNEVSGKRVMIPYEYIDAKNGWQPSFKLIIVERKPETREWTELTGTGTSNKNEGITAESKESIGFMTRMNCTAQIDEVNAAKFLYRYNNKSLSSVMDNEIRAMIESSFVEECANRTLDAILIEKSNIMTTIKKIVMPYFADRGVTITTLGLKGEFTYLNSEIQTSIDAKFKSAQDVITQKNLNEKVLSKARADSEAIKVQQETILQTLKLKELDNQSKAIEKWDGKTPIYSGNGGAIFQLPIK